MTQNKKALPVIDYERFAKQGDIMLASGVVIILLVMLVPLPTFFLDLMLSVSIAVSLTILITSMFLLSPVEFTIFPSLLLVTTLLRLALNIASTRLILMNGDQGTDHGRGNVAFAMGKKINGGRVLINGGDCASYFANNAASVAYVGPEPYLIQGSILENLTYGMVEQPQQDTVLQALRTDPLMQKIMAWEIASPSELVQRLTLARSKSMMVWVAESRGALVPPPGVDVGATNAVLLAAIQHLVLSSAAAGQFADLPLKSDADWERVRGIVKALVAHAYPA